MKNVFKNLYQRKFLLSFLLCFIIGIIISAFYGFRFEYYTNDDYQLSYLFSTGESHVLIVNYFLSSVIAIIQQLISFVNIFTVFQQIGCFISSVVITYVILKKSETYFGLFISTLVCSFIILSDVLIIQFSQTPVVMCVAGVSLAYYASLFEKNKNYKLFQLIVSGILIVFGSLFRFTPFLVSTGFALLLLICVICSNFYKTDKNDKFTSRSICSIRRCISFILVIAISFTSAFCLYLSSEMIKSSDSNYSKFVEYNNARTRIDDYATVPYEGNEAFYDSVGIKSSAELSLFRFDRNKYDAQTLNKIADYSENVFQEGDSKPVFAIKKTINRFICSINDIYGFTLYIVNKKLKLPISNEIFLLLCFIILIGIVALVFIIHKKKKKSSDKTNKNRIRQVLAVLVIISWAVFFLITNILYAQITDYNFLFIPLFLIVVTALFIDKAQNIFAYLIFSLAAMGLYLYQYSFRIGYRVSFAFLFPAIIFMLILIEYPKVDDSKRKGKIVKYVSYSLVLAGFAFCSAWCMFGFYPQCSLHYDMKLRNYIEESDNTFLVGTPTNACVDEGYYNTLLVPNLPQNEVLLSWSNFAPYCENESKEKQFKDILLDLINSDKRLVLEANGTKNLTDQITAYEDFYNTHYFDGKQTVKLKSEKTFSYSVECDDPERCIKEVGIYKVVKD